MDKRCYGHNGGSLAGPWELSSAAGAPVSGIEPKSCIFLASFNSQIGTYLCAPVM